MGINSAKLFTKVISSMIGSKESCIGNPKLDTQAVNGVDVNCKSTSVKEYWNQLFGSELV